MLDQSFSSDNFNKLFLKENRKGNFDKSHFTQGYLDKHQEFKNTVGEKISLKAEFPQDMKEVLKKIN